MSELSSENVLRQLLDELNLSRGINRVASFQGLIRTQSRSQSTEAPIWARPDIPQQKLVVPSVVSTPVQTPLGSPATPSGGIEPISPDVIKIDLSRVTTARKKGKGGEGPYGVTELGSFISTIKKAEAERGRKIDTGEIGKKEGKVRFLREYYRLPPEMSKEEKEEKEEGTSKRKTKKRE